MGERGDRGGGSSEGLEEVVWIQTLELSVLQRSRLDRLRKSRRQPVAEVPASAGCGSPGFSRLRKGAGVTEPEPSEAREVRPAPSNSQRLRCPLSRTEEQCLQKDTRSRRGRRQVRPPPGPSYTEYAPETPRAPHTAPAGSPPFDPGRGLILYTRDPQTGSVRHKRGQV
jgi:hypothetical protein